MLVDAAVAAGADCAKFQMRKLDEVYRASSLSGKDDDLAVEYTLDLLRRFELTTDQQRRIAAYCASKGIQYLCTPWDASSVATLETFGVQAYKVASADLTNLPLLAKPRRDRKDADRLDRHEHDRGDPRRGEISR